MHDSRWRKLADVVIDHSIALKEGEVVVISTRDVPDEMVTILIKKVYERGGIPLLTSMNEKVLRAYLKDTNEATMRAYGDVDMSLYKRANAVIRLWGSITLSELSDVPEERITQRCPPRSSRTFTLTPAPLTMLRCPKQWTPW
jgi:aminopeptidase